MSFLILASCWRRPSQATLLEASDRHRLLWSYIHDVFCCRVFPDLDTAYCLPVIKDILEPAAPLWVSDYLDDFFAGVNPEKPLHVLPLAIVEDLRHDVFPIGIQIQTLWVIRPVEPFHGLGNFSLVLRHGFGTV